MHIITTKNTIACSASLVWGWLIAILGGPHVLLSTLCYLVAIDYFAGVIASKYRGIDWDWDRAMRGVWRKLLYFFVVLFAAVMDRAVQSPEFSISTHGKIRVAFLVVLIGIEASSILRHFGACDITIPQWVKQMIDSFKQGKTGGK